MLQFHVEVLKKLHSMKSAKSLVESQDTEIPTSAESEAPDLDIEHFRQSSFMDNESPDLELEHFKQSDSESDGRDIEIGRAVDIDFDEITAEILKSRLSKILLRNQQLEDALEFKDRALRKVLARNAELENELKRKEAIRLSQLELLALRNVELERELHDSRKCHGNSLSSEG
jgi:hypothetical protein